MIKGTSLENLRRILIDIANDNTLSVGSKAIEQKARNTMKRRLCEAMHQVLAEVVENTPNLGLYRVEKGSMIGVDNEKVGIIPLDFQVAIKNMDCDPSEEEDAYNAKLAEQAEKAERAAKVKAENIARQAKERELKLKLKSLKADDIERIVDSSAIEDDDTVD